MKKIYKTLSCLLVSAFALPLVCGCKNGVSDMRRRERVLHERQAEEQRALQESEEQRRQQDETPKQKPTERDPELDPDFFFDPENSEYPVPPEDPNRRTSTEKPTPPPFPKMPNGGNKNEKDPEPKPVPFPLPHD